jgi:diguanylate cyclase (GGDEF)-like protein
LGDASSDPTPPLDAIALDWLRSALQGSGDVAYNWDVASDRLHWVGSTGDVFGELSSVEGEASRTISSGHSYNNRVHPEDLPIRLKALSDHFSTGRPFDCEYRLRNGHGSVVWVHDRGQAVMGNHGVPVSMTGILRIITTRKQSEARLERIANYDDLTGHYNKRRLREELEQALSYARRFSVPGAFIVIGVDKLALINNAYGHEVGDAILVTVGQRLDRFLRSSDVIGRLGGDRFGVVLCQCPEEMVVHAMERIIEVVRDKPIEINGNVIPLTISIGCVLFPGFVNTAYDLIAKAESALNQAKRAGRCCYSIYRASEQQTLLFKRSLDIAAQVQAAMRERRLSFVYQPIVRSDTQQVAKYECLLRMRGDHGELISAGAFVPVVEQLGMTKVMDRYVLDLAVDELRAHPDVSLAINISGLTATDQTWLRALMSAVKSSPEIGPRLVVEITETAALHDIEESARFVNVVRDLGCRVAIDDFGAGFTSFRHLKALTVDLVKIDGSFVRNLSQSQDNQLFIRNLLSLAETFGLQAVAEFVENEEDAALLTKAGVHFLQGYYFGRPNPRRPWLIGETVNPETVATTLVD